MMVKQVIPAADVVCVYKAKNLLGEGPLWLEREQRLFWIDIAGKKLYSLDPVSQQTKKWKMPAMIGCIAPRQEGGFIAAMGDGIYFIDLPSGEVNKQCHVPGDFRLNDGKCDRQGRFWFGNIDFVAGQGCLYCYEKSGKLSVKQDQVRVSNGLGWSPDDRVFYYTDSPTRKIYAYDFNSETGDISGRRVFAEMPEGEGVPDGLTVDQEGYVWSAQWNGSQVLRFSPDGKLDRVIDMPVLRPTSCMFGGNDLDVLYVTSASQDVGEKKKLPKPAGNLFAINVGITGLPEGEFAAE